MKKKPEYQFKPGHKIEARKGFFAPFVIAEVKAVFEANGTKWVETLCHSVMPPWKLRRCDWDRPSLRIKPACVASHLPHRGGRVVRLGLDMAQKITEQSD